MDGEFIIRRDCRHYRGDKPCVPGRLCADCPGYDKVDARLLVVKLAAAGDVLRTTPLLRALKAGYPSGRVTWVTDPEAAVLLRGNPLIDELVVLEPAGLLPLLAREFDWAAVLDKEPRAAALGALVKAKRKVGFTLDAAGRLDVLNPESLYALRLGLDDRLKFRGNRLTYPQIVFEMCGFAWEGEEYVFNLDPSAGQQALERLREAGWESGRPTVGLNTGAGRTFATKRWPEEHWEKLAAQIAASGEAQVLLLGGPEERERNEKLKMKLGSRVLDTGTDNRLDVFAWLVAAGDVVVTADTLALHLAVGLGRQVVLLMGSTSAAEIELYGRGEVLSAGLDCAPCYLQSCPRGAPCMSALDPRDVLAAVRRRLDEAGCEGPGEE